MRAGSQNKHKAMRSRKKEGYYKNQFLRTAQNKLRRKQRRARRALVWNTGSATTITLTAQAA